MQTVHIESSCVYPAIRDFRVVGFMWASVEIVKEIVGKIVRFLDSSDNRAHNLLKY
jgi:hypothetical protein